MYVIAPSLKYVFHIIVSKWTEIRLIFLKVIAANGLQLSLIFWRFKFGFARLINCDRDSEGILLSGLLTVCQHDNTIAHRFIHMRKVGRVKSMMFELGSIAFKCGISHHRILQGQVGPCACILWLGGLLRSSSASWLPMRHHYE